MKKFLTLLLLISIMLNLAACTGVKKQYENDIITEIEINSGEVSGDDSDSLEASRPLGDKNNSESSGSNSENDIKPENDAPSSKPSNDTTSKPNTSDSTSKPNTSSGTATTPKEDVLPAYDNNKTPTKFIIGEREENVDCMEYVYTSTNRTAYDNYVKKLKESGYKSVSAHTVGDNAFQTFNGYNTTVTIGYYHYSKEVRLTEEPLIESYAMKKSTYNKVTTSLITTIGLGQTTYPDSDDNGLSQVIRLEDGRFIVIDGGHTQDNSGKWGPKNKNADLEKLIEVIKDQSKEYTQKPIIAAWLITHVHTDHMGIFSDKEDNSMTKAIKTVKDSGITVECFMTNFLRYSKSLRDDYEKVQETAKQLNAKLLRVHTGQVYYFADVKIEILYTVENQKLYKIKNDNVSGNLYGNESSTSGIDFNSTSIVCKMTFGGRTTYLMPADATGSVMEFLANTYDNYLQSDIYLLAHHGYDTRGNENAMKTAHELINPKIVIWPIGFIGLEGNHNLQSKAYNKAAFSGSNFKAAYVAGDYGDLIVIPLNNIYNTSYTKAKNKYK